MKFTKMHGLGNDFVMVDCVHQALQEETLPALARAVCDRHFGVGADGLIMALPSQTAEFRMRLINADGSEAEHCGNGIRCVARLLFDHGHLRPPDADGRVTVSVETVGRINHLTLTTRQGEVESVAVDMGVPDLRRGAVGMTRGDAEEEMVEEPLQLTESATLRFTGVSMGNPHIVTFVDDTQSFPVTELGPPAENHPHFPRRTNVEFVQVISPQELRMRVWERGAGETLACGTGACATLVAAHRTGRAGRAATVHLLGGDLEIEWTESGRIIMTGPAVTVYEGEWLG